MVGYINGLLSTLRAVDFVDIAVIAVFIYMALVWFEKARARFVMIGLFIMGSVYVIARFFDLYLTTAVFQAFFAVLLIIIVIIFQDDFRHFFEQIALWGIMRKNKKRYIASFYENIDIIANAVAELVRKKIGALIVIKGRDVLDRHVGGGVYLNGQLSQIMLENIFESHFPGHDGAVVIEGNRIVRFGVHLPLSVNLEVIGHFGTRHAAALGLSERADSLCIVVSEEQGTISVAEGEIIALIKDISSLRMHLENFYQRIFPYRKKFLSEMLMGHIVEKALAFILACGFWAIFGQRQEIIRRDFVVPVEYRNLAPDWIIGEPKPKEATASLSGREREFGLMNSKDLKISLDMSRAKEGENKLLLSREIIRAPAGLSVVSINPSEVTVTAYKLLKIDVPVEVATSGRLSSELVLKEIKAAPSSVTLIVPSIISKDKITVTTDAPIDLRQISQTQVITPKLVIPPEARFVDDKYPDVKVTVEVEKKE